MSVEELEYDAEILRNKGVPVTLAVVSPVMPTLPVGQSAETLRAAGIELPPLSWEKVRNEAGEVVTETRHLRFTVNVLADMEVEFQSLGLWQNAARFRNIDCARRTFALAFGGDKVQWGEAMLETELAQYGSAMAAAWAMANGVDPQMAMTVMEKSRQVIAGGNVAEAEALLEKLATDLSNISLMPSGSATGSDSDT